MAEDYTPEEAEELEEMSIEEMAEDASDKVDILLELLIDKGVITQEEFNKKAEELFGEEGSEEETEGA